MVLTLLLVFLGGLTGGMIRLLQSKHRKKTLVRYFESGLLGGFVALVGVSAIFSMKGEGSGYDAIWMSGVFGYSGEVTIKFFSRKLGLDGGSNDA